MACTEDVKAAQGFIEWALEKGLTIAAVCCGDFTASFRQAEERPPVVITGDVPDPDDDAEYDEEGNRLPPPRDVYSAYAREFGVPK